MPTLLAIQDSATEGSPERYVAGVVLIFVLIVLTSGLIAIFLYLRRRMREAMRPPPKPRPDGIDAWVESGRRLASDSDGDSANDDETDPDDDSDDDDGEPRKPLPVAPETSASLS